ncbi:ribosome recycling factor [Actinotignum urinale]|uniref:Ribosome-recycling factor n=1 Tax=Actinotignum urinale TaxID=190146 RepID=A0AAW9HXB6_9ACTO|nr:ribosome recycling factor [Actinotignum urinale]MDY5129175.1 ribosome recycling factor [Actinotignum urinale]MDY5132362.1 ribosome recycling factor [Actinotignum urinale]MDY5151469.1 ribosome recycling factor [Actinotignum urinale]MDY5154992.1 ribosome recycling factor [Actinotignum urinale]MDY5160753.1 ribosome recycling factor [Actinotignum urinale]
MIQDVLKEAKEKMTKAVEVTQEDFSAIRSGRANVAMFNPIFVDYYGSPTPLQQLATITIPEPRTVMITPFDPTAKQAIDRALRESDLGVNPSDDGNVIRVNLPALTEERRKDYVKMARTRAEDGRVSIRGVRRKAKDALDKIKKDGDAGEDEVKRAEEELETLTKKHVERVDELLVAKEKDLLEV